MNKICDKIYTMNKPDSTTRKMIDTENEKNKRDIINN